MEFWILLIGSVIRLSNDRIFFPICMESIRLLVEEAVRYFHSADLLFEREIVIWVLQRFFFFFFLLRILYCFPHLILLIVNCQSVFLYNCVYLLSVVIIYVCFQFSDGVERSMQFGKTFRNNSDLLCKDFAGSS